MGWIGGKTQILEQVSQLCDAIIKLSGETRGISGNCSEGFVVLREEIFKLRGELADLRIKLLQPTPVPQVVDPSQMFETFKAMMSQEKQLNELTKYDL